MQDMGTEGVGQKPLYEFEDIGQQLIKVLLKSAEDQVTAAQNLLADTKALTADIETQIKEHASMIDSMNGRLKEFGTEVLNAHKKYLNGK
jgi:predicted  nucleic acid-binding Zn-ribbon protein